MKGPEHRLVAKSKRFRGKVRGGRVAACSCGAMTFVADERSAVVWHAGHKVEEAKPERILERVAAAVDEIERELAVLVGA